MTVKVELDSAALVRGVEEGRRAIEALSNSLEKLDRASLRQVQAELNNLKKSPLDAVRALAANMETQVGGAFDKIGRLRPQNKLNEVAAGLKAGASNLMRVISDVNETLHKQSEQTAKVMEDLNQGLDRKLSVRQQAIKEATRVYEDMILNNPEAKVTPKGEAALYRLMQAGAQMSPTHVRIAKSWAQTYKDEANAIIDAITAQTVQRSKSASRFTLDDTRHLFGLPSVTEMRDFSTMIKNQMLQRGRSASRFTLEDTRALLGLPSADEMRDFSTTLRNQMLGRNRSASRFTLDDTRALLGLPPVEEMRNFASALKNQMLQRGRSASRFTLEDTRALLGLPPLSDIARIRSDMEGRMRDLKTMARDAGLRPGLVGGEFSPYNAKHAKKLADQTPKVSALSTVIRKLGDNMGYTHSMARGLTSGLGLLWLTWGAMVPIFTGAAISNALMTTAKAGMEVEQNLMKIHVLGGEASKDVSQLSIKMLELAKNGPAGPKEISAAMKTLSLAGLQASEVYEAIKPVLNFSVAGDTTIEKSADVLSSVATAYKYTAKDYAYIADIISVAAASSKASVETMGEAFKSSSVVFTKFGVTLEDTALVMAMLNNVGVQGTAAGIAYRNMLTDLTGRTEKSKKALSELGMSMSDVVNKSGKMKPLEDIFAKIVKGLERKSGGEQFDILNRLFTERGDKGAIEMLTNLRKVAEESGITIVQAYQKLQTEINNASGFTVIAAAKMSQTSTNAIKMALSSMEAAFVESFNTMRPYIVEVAGELRKIFQSEGFRSSLETLIEIVGALVKGFFKWSKAIGLVLSGFLAFKGTALALGSLAAAYEAVGVAVAGATGAMVAFNGAQALFLKSHLGLFLTGVALAIVGVTAAWKTFSSSTRDAARSVDVFSGTNVDELLKSLESERDRLVKVNEARQRKISLMALEGELAVIQLRSQEPPEIRDLAAKVAAYKPIDVPDNANGGSEARMRSGLAESAHKQNVAELARLRQEYQDKITKAEQIAKAIAIWEKTLAGPARVPGDNNTTFPDKIGKMPHGLSYKEENPVTLLKQQMQDQIAIVEIYRKADVISHAQAEENKYQITVEYESAAKKAITDKWKKTQEIFLKEYAAAKGNKERQQALLEASQSQALEYNDSYMSVVSESNRRQIQYNEELAVSAAKVTRAYDKFLRGKEAEVSEEEAKAAIYRANKRMYPEIVAQQEAQLKYYAEFDKSIAELKESYDLMREAQILAFASGDESRVIMFGAQAEKVAQAMRNARRDKELIAKRSGDAAYRKTLEDEYGKFVDEFSLSLADGVATAIMDGGKQGGDKLRKYLQDLLIRKPMVLFLEAQIKGMFGGTGGVNGTGLLQDLFKFSTGRMFETASAATDVAASWTDAMANFVIGGRASGGTVNPNSMYRVNENGIEMLSVGGKDYLMTGAQQGSITPAGASGVNISYAPEIHIDSRTDQAQVAALVHRAVQAGNAKLVDDLRQARVI